MHVHYFCDMDKDVFVFRLTLIGANGDCVITVQRRSEKAGHNLKRFKHDSKTVWKLPETTQVSICADSLKEMGEYGRRPKLRDMKNIWRFIFDHLA